MPFQSVAEEIWTAVGLREGTHLHDQAGPGGREGEGKHAAVAPLDKGLPAHQPRGVRQHHNGDKGVAAGRAYRSATCYA